MSPSVFEKWLAPAEVVAELGEIVFCDPNDDYRPVLLGARAEGRIVMVRADVSNPDFQAMVFDVASGVFFLMRFPHLRHAETGTDAVYNAGEAYVIVSYTDDDLARLKRCDLYGYLIPVDSDNSPEINFAAFMS